jgi:hypothetical protein
MANVLTKFKPEYTSRETLTVIIPNGTSVSPTIDLTNTSLLGFVTPSAWTTAALNIEVSDDGTNWSSAYDAYGSLIGSVATPVVSSRYAVDMSALLPWRYVRLRSGTTATPVNQGADRSFKIIKRVLA